MKTLNLFVLIGFIAILIVGLTPYIEAKIVSSGTAVQTSTGSGTGTVTSVGSGTGLTGGPIVAAGTLSLLEALTGTIGGVKVLNCSGTDKISGWTTTNTPVCTADSSGGSGTVTSITGDSTITVNPSPLVTTGVLMATNATLTQLGVTKLTNCSTGFYLNGWNATNIPNCVGELKNGTVTSITAGTGLAGGAITTSGTIDLNQATTSTLGGVILDANCTSGYFLAQTNATGKLSCRGETANVSSITASTGLSGGVITSSGTIALLEATSSALGGFKSTGANCSSGYFLANVNATGQLSCVGELKNGTVTSITASTGLSGGAISSSGTIALLEALTGTIGGVRVANCSAGNFFNTWGATNIPSCSTAVTSVATGTGLTGGTITGTGTISIVEATTSALGGVKELNCSAGQQLNGYTNLGVPTCITPLTTTNNSFQPAIFERQFARLKPLGTSATTFTADGWAAFTANGTAVSHALANQFYIKYSNTSAAGLSANGSAGITQTTAQTQLRYLPIVRTSIMRNGSNANMREWFGISDNADIMYFSRKGGIRGAGIFFDTNSSNTQWQCCTNDAAAAGMTCTATGIDVTANAPYNLTLNLTNYPTDIRCLVQNNTASGSITKTTNVPSDTASNMFVQNVAISTTAGNNVNYSIAYMYLETK